MCELIYCNALAFVVGFVLDAIFGEPPSAFHPVVWVGKIISKFGKYFYGFRNKLVSGFFFVLSVLFIVSVITGLFVLSFFYLKPVGHIIYCAVAIYIVFSSVSVKSLKEHALNVKDALAKWDLVKARRKLSFMVSRDTYDMEPNKVITSTVESVSENFVDGVLSPMFYYLFFGVVGAVIFKTVSTFDSMIGYLNDRYRLFGRFAAKFDDVLNFIPARLSIIFVGIASLLLKLDFPGTLKTFIKYRRSHRSPNSAHPMSAFAGALNIRLGGKTKYNGVWIEKPYIGDSTRKPKVRDIDRAVNLLLCSSFLAFLFCFLSFCCFILSCHFL